MRLTGEEIAAIKTSARETFGASAVVRLFGSRIHDHPRGGYRPPRGDLPLLVETHRRLADFVPRDILGRLT